MVINIETQEVDWETIISMIRLNNNVENPSKNIIKKWVCMKCKLEFFNNNYNGNYPLCDKHRNNTFKEKRV